MKKEKIKVKVNKHELNKSSIMWLNNLRYVKDFEDQKIYLCDEPHTKDLHSIGLGCCALVKSNINGEDAYVIMYDDAFLQFPQYVRDCFFYHEIGHFVHKHTQDLNPKDAKIIMLKRTLGILPAMELEADAYAASVVGVDTLMSAFSFFIRNTDAPLMGKIEMFRRMFILKYNDLKRNKHH